MKKVTQVSRQFFRDWLTNEIPDDRTKFIFLMKTDAMIDKP